MKASIPGAQESLRGIRVVTKSWNGGPASRLTVVASCFAGDCSRVETVAPAPSAYRIERRDLQKSFRVFLNQRTYQIIPLFDLISSEERARFAQSGKHWRKRYAGNRTATREFHICLRYERTEDERLMWGCAARRWILSREDEHDGRHGENRQETVTEAWYIEPAELERNYPPFSQRLMRQGFCYAMGGDERAVIENTGSGPTGLCVHAESTTVSHGKTEGRDAWEQRTSSGSTVTSIAEETFLDSFFAPPPDFISMPLYPTRSTMAKLEMTRALHRLGGSLRRAFLK